MACMAAKMGLLVKWQYLIFSYNENDIEEAKQMAKDNNLILELQKSSRFWKDDPLMPKNKDYYIERKVMKIQPRCEKVKKVKIMLTQQKGLYCLVVGVIQ